MTRTCVRPADLADALRRAATLVLLAVAVGGCYMPVRFDAEIEISRRGFYSLIFDGYMVKVPLYADLRKGKITPAEERKRVELIRADLTRDSSVKEFSYIRQGHFKIHWQKAGDLLAAKMVSFVRRNENVLSIRYVKTNGSIVMAGTPIGPSAKKQLSELGLDMQGEIRLFTDAKVVAHNATSVADNRSKGPRFKTYTWRIGSILEPPPSLVISLR